MILTWKEKGNKDEKHGAKISSTTRKRMRTTKRRGIRNEK